MPSLLSLRIVITFLSLFFMKLLHALLSAAVPRHMWTQSEFSVTLHHHCSLHTTLQGPLLHHRCSHDVDDDDRSSSSQIVRVFLLICASRDLVVNSCVNGGLYV